MREGAARQTARLTSALAHPAARQDLTAGHGEGSGSDVSVANGTGSGDGVFVGSGSGEGTGFLIGDSQ